MKNPSPGGFMKDERREENRKMLGWMTMFGILAVGSSSLGVGESSRIAVALFIILFLAAWFARSAGRRVW